MYEWNMWREVFIAVFGIVIGWVWCKFRDLF